MHSTLCGVVAYVVAKMKDLPFAEATSYYLVSQVQEITPAERHLPLQMLVLIKRNSKTVTSIGINKPELERKAKFVQMVGTAWV